MRGALTITLAETATGPRGRCARGSVAKPPTLPAKALRIAPAPSIAPMLRAA